MTNKLLIICGPTGSGKSSLAIECAKILNTDIICADSMTIYKGFDVGTAKVTTEEAQGIRHHLISICEPNDAFTVSDYKSRALSIINELFKQGKTPIICGGTGFYINSILYDNSYGNSAPNLEVREKYLRLAKESGNEYVYNVLREFDPETATKLHFNDVKRVVRALEIYFSGTKKSDIIDSQTPVFDYECYSYNYEREILYQRINKRVDDMIRNGLVEEVRNLVLNGAKKESQSMQAIGYKEILSYLNNELSLEDAILLLKQNTRRYAKRQITFFKKIPNIIYLEPNDSVIETAKEITRGFI